MRSESLSQCFQLKDFARLVVAGGGCGCRRDKARLCGARIVSSKYKYLSLLTPHSSVLPAHNQPLPQPADIISSGLGGRSLHITVAGDDMAQLRMRWSCITGHPASQS